MTIGASPLPADRAERLRLFLAERHSVPFAWGYADCAMLAFDSVRAMTGRDPAADLRGRYASALQARSLLRSLGGMLGLVRSRCGAELAWDDAVDGDVVLLRSSVCRGPLKTLGALGIRWRSAVVAQGAKGLVVVTGASASNCWGVR